MLHIFYSGFIGNWVFFCRCSQDKECIALLFKEDSQHCKLVHVTHPSRLETFNGNVTDGKHLYFKRGESWERKSKQMIKRETVGKSVGPLYLGLWWKMEAQEKSWALQFKSSNQNSSPKHSTACLKTVWNASQKGGTQVRVSQTSMDSSEFFVLLSLQETIGCSSLR